MTDGPGQEPAPTDPEIDPELDAEIDAEINAVRALLGEARVTNPVPADVAARLDDVLAGLAAEGTAAERGAARRGATETAPPADGTPATVVPLRRRWAPRALVAAAAVVVLGGAAYGVGRVVQSSGGTSASSASTGATSLPSAATASGESAGGSSTKAPVPGATPEFAAVLPSLRTGHFAADARRVLHAGRYAGTGSTDRAAGQKATQKAARSPSAAGTQHGCVGPTPTRGASTAVRLDGRLAVLVVHAPRSGTRLVQAWSCDGRSVLASARLPVG